MVIFDGVESLLHLYLSRIIQRIASTKLQSDIAVVSGSKLAEMTDMLAI